MEQEVEKATARESSLDIREGPALEMAKEEPTVGTAQAWGTSDAPDGGMAAWLVVLGAWCTSFCSFGWLNSIGEFQQYYQLSLLRGHSASTISWIPSLQVFFMMAMGPIIGRIYDSRGPQALILGGTFLHVFGLMMASVSTQYYQVLLSQGVCSAIGVACIFQPALNCIQGWFNKNRGLAYGILSTGSSVGGVVFPIMVSRLIREVGFGWAMRIPAFLILFLLIIANLTVKAYHPPRPHKVTRKQLLQPLREPGFVAVMIGVFLFTFGLFCALTYITVQAISAGMDPSLAQYLLAILNAASLFGRLASGIAADKYGKYNVFVVVCYITGIVILALWLPASGNGAIIAFAVLFGFFSGAYVSLIPALVVRISPPNEIGFRTGLVFLLSSFGGLTTGPIAGEILANFGGWDGLKIFAGVFCLAGTTFVLAARFIFTGPILAKAF